jgi:transcriptional regulator GlxA family with amidase domain
MPSAPPVPDLRLVLLPLPEFAMLPFGGFLDTLRFSADDEDYSSQRYCRWRIAGATTDALRSSSGVAVAVDIALDAVDFSDVDVLVLFGGRNAQATAALAPVYRAALRRAAAFGVALACVDNASFLLAACGLLDGREVALHWRHVAEFRASYPRVGVAEGRLYCFDGDRISCAGGSAAIDLAVEIVARHCGRARARKGLADMLVDETRDSRHALRSLDGAGLDAGSGRHVARAIALMRARLEVRTTVEAIAAESGIGRRQLDRLFRARYGVSAREYWTEMRLQYVRWRLVNSNHALAVIADEIGAVDTSHLGRLFRRRFGVSPGRFRERPEGENDLR